MYTTESAVLLDLEQIQKQHWEYMFRILLNRIIAMRTRTKLVFVTTSIMSNMQTRPTACLHSLEKFSWGRWLPE